ncbi:MAG: hypothetical protein KGV51_00300 [Moraxellaceae bacterium]|nr:hypothetical protein [Moraxellaceae bacterium]
MKNKQTKMKYLAVSVISSLAMIASTAHADVEKKQIGDLEIYAKPSGDTSPSLLLMLDVSASMWAVDVKKSELAQGITVGGEVKTQNGTDIYFWATARDRNGNRAPNLHGGGLLNTNFCHFLPQGKPFADSATFSYTDPNDSSKTFTRTLPRYDGRSLSGCVSNGKKYYNRISALRNALLDLFTSDKIADGTRIGLGVYSANFQGNTGQIVSPVRPLDFESRKEIVDSISEMTASGGTPTITAFAEAGAHMLGTSSYDNTQGAGNLSKQLYPYAEKIGYNVSVDSAKKTDGSYTYIQGAGNAECAANGIYLMTDGVPYLTPRFPHNENTHPVGIKSQSSSYSIHGWYGNHVTYDNANTVGRYFMNNSLNNQNPITTCENSQLKSLTKYPEIVYSGWECMGEYAKRLKEGQTPNHIKIRTATGGLGGLFAGMGKTVTIDPATGKKKINYSCNSGNHDPDNLCKLGGSSYGGGGFSHLTDAKSIAESIQRFIDSLNRTLPTKPSGTIVIPNDPFSTKGQQAIAYLPMLEAKPSGNVAIWPGNLKKYGIEEGTLIGKSSAKLFDNSKGEGEFNTSTQDWWSDKNYDGIDSNGNEVTNTAIHSGGIYAHLKTPESGLASVRTVYVEDNGTLKQFSVNASGKIQVNGSELAEDSFADTALYNGKMIGNLLQFLGFNSGTKDGENTPQEIATNGITDIADYVDYTLEQPTEVVRVLGASPHSAPVALSYGVELDTLGKIKENTRDDYVLFGSMDGALHLVNAKNETGTNTSKETFAILTKAMLEAQPEAIVPSALGKAVGVPTFGVDSTWLIDESFNYDLATHKATVDGNVMAYGGFRMGAEGLYGINLGNSSTDTPTISFALTPKNTDFSRLGQIWNKPKLARIKESNNDTDTGTDVLIFGGGYDTCYEDASYQVGDENFTDTTLRNQRNEVCKTNTQAVGNAVYIVNAKTGDLIWSTDQLNSSQKANLKNSVVADVVTLDRNDDGFIDHLYFADLGGQIFRIDFTNGGTTIYTGDANNLNQTTATSFAVQNFVRLYHDNDSDKKYIRRFYQKPVISMQREGSFNDGKLFALLNIASGDRSSPLSKMRTNTANSDRVYAIFDTDVTEANKKLYNSDYKANLVENLTISDLVNLPEEMGSAPVSDENKQRAHEKIKAKRGWYYPLTRFDGYNEVMFSKAVGKYAVIDNRLYMTVYNPDMRYTAPSAKESCQATIKGASERELYCLPFGICPTANGTGGFARAGVGIQELALGPRGTGNKRNQRVLIGTRTLADRAKNRVNFGEGTGSVIGTKPSTLPDGTVVSTPKTGGGSGSMGEFIANEAWVLESKTWYDSKINDE